MPRRLLRDLQPRLVGVAWCSSSQASQSAALANAMPSRGAATGYSADSWTTSYPSSCLLSSARWSTSEASTLESHVARCSSGESPPVRYDQTGEIRERPPRAPRHGRRDDAAGAAEQVLQSVLPDVRAVAVAVGHWSRRERLAAGDDPDLRAELVEDLRREVRGEVHLLDVAVLHARTGATKSSMNVRPHFVPES